MVTRMSTKPKSAAVTMAGRSMSAREDINGLQVEQPTGDRMKGVWVDALERRVSWMLRFASAVGREVARLGEQARSSAEHGDRPEGIARIVGLGVGGLAGVAGAAVGEGDVQAAVLVDDRVDEVEQVALGAL